MMEIKFCAQQSSLGMSDCQTLCVKSSRDIEELASRSGWPGLPGQQVNVTVGTALNMLVLSTATSHSVEWQAMGPWLPGLRNEALLKLGEDFSNWTFDGTSEQHKAFWPTFYGSSDTVRPGIARLLGCDLKMTTRELHFFSQNDVECLSNSEFDLGYYLRAPRFTIDAHALAARVRAACGGPLFTAKSL
jgi:hypothetical protein